MNQKSLSEIKPRRRRSLRASKVHKVHLGLPQQELLGRLDVAHQPAAKELRALESKLNEQLIEEPVWPEGGDHEYELHLVSDSYVGLDQMQPVTVRVAEACD